jgi:hypothetical protein
MWYGSSQDLSRELNFSSAGRHISISFYGPYDMIMPDGWVEHQDVTHAEYVYNLYIERGDTFPLVYDRANAIVKQAKEALEQHTRNPDVSRVASACMEKYSGLTDDNNSCYVPHVEAYENAVIISVLVPPGLGSPGGFVSIPGVRRVYRVVKDSEPSFVKKVYDICNDIMRMHDDYYRCFSDKIDTVRRVVEFFDKKQRGMAVFHPLFSSCGHIIMANVLVPPDVEHLEMEYATLLDLPAWKLVSSTARVNEFCLKFPVKSITAENNATFKVESIIDFMEQWTDKYKKQYAQDIAAAELIALSTYCKYCRLDHHGRTILAYTTDNPDIDLPRGWKRESGQLVFSRVVSSGTMEAQIRDELHVAQETLERSFDEFQQKYGDCQEVAKQVALELRRQHFRRM